MAVVIDEVEETSSPPPRPEHVPLPFSIVHFDPFGKHFPNESRQGK